MELKDKTIGIIGTGHIGLHVARIARGFRMRTLASDRAPGTTQSGLLEITYTTLDDLLARSDIVTLHTALTTETHHLINAERLKTMQRGAILINTGRGGLVDTPALLAALDVLEDEEHLAEFGSIMLRRRPNLVLTPHIALDTQEALDRILHTTIENIRAFTARRPHNVISGPAIDDGPREFSEA
jgi:D-lactate dehydrogenase